MGSIFDFMKKKICLLFFVFRGYTLFNDTTRCFMGFNPIFRYAEQNCDWSVAVSLKIVEDKKLLVDFKKHFCKLSFGFEIKTDELLSCGKNAVS